MLGISVDRLQGLLDPACSCQSHSAVPCLNISSSGLVQTRRGLPCLALGPEAQRPVGGRGEEEAGLEGRPGDGVHGAQVPPVARAVLLRVARAAQVDRALLRAWPRHPRCVSGAVQRCVP